MTNEATVLLVRELRAAKDAAGLSLAQIGAHTHYSRASWERWLNGKRLVPAHALAGFAELAGADGRRLEGLREQAAAEPAGSGPGACGPGDAAGSAAPRRWSAPAQLPAAIADFTGRDVQIAELLAALVPRPDGALGHPTIAVVRGGGGVGKTALAVHVAHLAATQYPDGALATDLRGAGPTPRDPGDVLAGWLRELGEPASRIPEAAEARSSRLRSLVRDRAMLFLLDNARDAAQIRPLLPAAERCGVLVTSRGQLVHLPAARHVLLEPMTFPEALSLLERIAGADRVAREPRAAAAVLDACAGLPLALRICAARLETRPSWSVQTLAERVADEHRRLDELAVGDLAARSSFDMSYAQLAERDPAPGSIAPARAFRLLGLATTPDISLRAAAALFGVDADRAEFALEALVDAHLLEGAEPERYRFHDLIRLYAAEQAGRADAPERRAALARMLSWYVVTTDVAGHLAHPGRPWLPVDAAGPEPEPLGSSEDAMAWYHRERANLLAAAELAADAGLYDHGWQLPHVMWPFFLMRSNRSDWLAAVESGLRCADALGDRTVQGRMHSSRAQALTELSRFEEAIGEYTLALEIARELGLAPQESSTLTNLCIVHWEAGRLEEAIGYGQAAVARFRASGDRLPLGRSLNNLGHALLLAGRWAQARTAADEAVQLGVEEDNGLIEADGLLIRAESTWRSGGDSGQAEGWFRQALETSAELGQLRNEAQARQFFGGFLAANSRPEEAVEMLVSCLAIFEAMEHPKAVAVREQLAGLGGGPVGAGRFR